MNKCTWTINHINDMYEGETWDTQCKQIFQFMEGDIQDNGFLFCPYCGNKILEDKECK